MQPCSKHPVIKQFKILSVRGGGAPRINPGALQRPFREEVCKKVRPGSADLELWNA